MRDGASMTYAAMDKVDALYLHIPFCARKCAYCDFVSFETVRDDPLMTAYVQSLRAQLAELEKAGLLEDCRTAYVGGGTPTMVPTAALETLVRELKMRAPAIDELSCEANPDSLDDETLSALVRAGATRLSVGVQSLHDGELRSLGRIHDADTARLRVSAAVTMGLDVSIDLMCATPAQTEASWETTVREAIKLGVGHVSVYPLQIEEGTPLAERVGDDEPAWNDPDVQAARMEEAAHLLEDAGFVRYEVASYARPGKACRHNEAYWTGRPYIGLGCGAASMLSRAGYECLRTCCPQLPELDEDTVRVRLETSSTRQQIARDSALASLSFDLEILDEAQAAAEDLMLGMRLTRGVGPACIERARMSIGADRVDFAFAEIVSRGLAQWQGRRLVPTHTGWLLGNELYGILWNLAPGEVSTARSR